MAEQQALVDMSEEQLLDHADATAETARQAEAELLRVAYQWAVVKNPDRLDPAETGKPGREKARRLGGEGVAEVSEFAAAQLGARIGRSPYAAGRLIADAQDLHHRLPELWGRVEAGQVRSSYARHVAVKTRELTESEAGYVDAAVAESADGRLPWTRFEALVEAKVAAAAPALARAREEKAAQATFAKQLRTEAYGMGSFLIRADLATIDQIDEAVAINAEALAETMPDSTEDQRRVRAILMLATPGSHEYTDIADLMPAVTLFVHTYAGTTSPQTGTATGAEAEMDPETGRQEPIVRVEGHGPVTQTWVRSVLGPTCRFKITPVIDLNNQAPVDAYEIPDRHRQAVRLITPTAQRRSR
jgi:hypothetical protein